MLTHLVLFKFNRDLSDEGVETIMRQTRCMLLKIPEALAVRCGRNLQPGQAWDFFVAVEVQSSAKLQLFQSAAVFIKYLHEVVKPHTCERLVLNYEMAPAQDPRFCGVG